MRPRGIKHVILYAAAFACGPLLVVADPLPVQSGEHATFSRLVTPLSGGDWSVTQDGREVVLTYPNHTDGFQTETVFDLIPQDRIRQVRAVADQLTVTLACDCAVSAVTERGLYVVIDVADSVEGLEAPDSLISPNAPVQTAASTPPVARPQTRPTNTGSATEGVLNWSPSTFPQANPEIVTALKERLSSELNTAAQRGVLSPNPRANPTQVPTAQDQPSTAIQLAQEPKPEPLPAPPRDLANLRISTSRDLPQTFRDLAEITSTQGEVCPPDSQLAVTTWGDDRPFAEQIAQARKGLYGERDRINPEVAQQLAQAYLYFGFGAEALTTLRLDAEIAKNTQHLITLAQIMDGDRMPTPNAFSGLAECEGETALWGMLAAPMPPEGALPAPDGALRTLNALPSHLRVLLAPKLHKVLLAYGNPDGAAASLRSLERFTDDLPPAAKVAQAKGSLEDGDIEAGKQQLADVVSQNAEQSPKALIALVDAKLKADQPLSADTARLVEAFAQELRNSDLGPELRRVQILSLAQSGQFDAAFEERKRTSDDDLDDSVDAQLLRRLTSNASDIVFLDHALDQSSVEIARLSQNDVLALATRFLTLGFPAEAERIVNVLPPLPRQADQQILSAQIHLAMQKPFRAQADLLNLEGEEADRLRADAKRMSGLFDEAHALYQQLNETEGASETAWLADDWRSLTPPDTPTFGAAAALPETPDPLASNTGMLARSAALLDQSTQARQTLQDLLDAESLRTQTPQE